jgi:hypothetical protein
LPTEAAGVIYNEAKCAPNEQAPQGVRLRCAQTIIYTSTKELASALRLLIEIAAGALRYDLPHVLIEGASLRNSFHSLLYLGIRF